MFAYCENNPVNALDSDGHFGWIIAGALIGGTISAAIEIGSQISSGKSLARLDWKQVGIQAVSGALSGALTASGVGIIGAIAGNVAISSATSIISDYVSGSRSIKQIRNNAIENGIIGGIAGAYGGRGAQYGMRIKSSTIVRVGRYAQITKHSFMRYGARRIIGRELRKGMVKAVKASIYSRAYSPRSVY